MKKTISLFLAVILLFLLPACGKQKVTKTPEESVPAVNLMANIQASSVAGKETDEVFIESQMKFSLDLFQRTLANDADQNVLISPLSVILALSMAANGAHGATKAEMEAVLGDGISVEEMNRYLYTYIQTLPSGEKYKAQIANSVWFRNSGITVKPDFLQTTADYYGAEAYQSEFDGQTVKDINDWVKENTDGMIEKIMDGIEPGAVMYLINALVFDAEWDRMYPEYKIADREFHNISGETQTVDMMFSDERLYIGDENASGFIKNYKDGKYSFAVLMPNEGVGIGEYVADLTHTDLQNILQNAEQALIRAGLPKFTYEYNITLNTILQQMGIETAFKGNADFTKLGTADSGNIYLDKVLHKTFITVDERGTKAGAVTLEGFGAEGEPNYRYEVILDRPFVYMILDNATNLPIFMGTVTDIGK